MASKNVIAAHYQRLMAQWPRDALRPNQPFTLTFAQRAAAYGIAQPEWATKGLEDQQKNKKSPQTEEAVAPALSAKQELADINVLFSLLENRYSKKYPLSPEVLKPTSKPEYYDKLMEEIEKAPTKSWWQAKVDEWKGKIRWT